MNTFIRRIRRPLLLALCLAVVMPAVGQSMRKVSPQKISGYWILLNTKVDADVPNSGNLYKPGCVAVSYTIGSDGVPQGAKVEKVVPQSDLGSVATSIVSHMRYGPSLTNHSEEPVATYYVIPFNAPDDPAGQQKLMAACQLPGYEQS